jgi:hypothetical protein
MQWLKTLRSAFFRIGTVGLWAVALGCGLVLTGCTSFNVQVRCAIPNAVVTVKDPSGHAGPQTGTAPLDATVDYGSTDRIDVEADPPANLLDQYNPAYVSLTKADYDALPGNDPTHKFLQINLTEREYVQVRAAESYLDPVHGWVGIVREERAFRSVSEQGGAVAAQIQEFGRNFCITGMSISPDGQRIVYSATDFDMSTLPTDLSTVRLDQDNYVRISSSKIGGLRTIGSGIEHITEEDFKDFFPTFSQDGNHLLFCSNRRRQDSNDILWTGADGRGGVTDIYICPDRRSRAIKPTQAVNGTIAFAVYPEGWRNPGDVQIYTTGSNQFPTEVVLGTMPSISPNGKQIAYIGGDGNLWVVNVDGSNNNQLTTDAPDILKKINDSLQGPEQAAELAQYNYLAAQGTGTLLLYYMPYSYPSWSPGGKHILYTTKAGLDPTGRPHDDVWIMDANGDGKNTLQLTTNPSQNRFPLMAPDQKSIYFYSNRGVTWSIWSIPPPRDYIPDPPLQ